MTSELTTSKIVSKIHFNLGMTGFDYGSGIRLHARKYLMSVSINQNRLYSSYCIGDKWNMPKCAWDERLELLFKDARYLESALDFTKLAIPLQYTPECTGALIYSNNLNQWLGYYYKTETITLMLFGEIKLVAECGYFNNDWAVFDKEVERYLDNPYSDTDNDHVFSYQEVIAYMTRTYSKAI